MLMIHGLVRDDEQPQQMSKIRRQRQSTAAADRALRRRCPCASPWCARWPAPARPSASIRRAATGSFRHGGGRAHFANNALERPPARADELGGENARPPLAPPDTAAPHLADR